MAFRNAARPLVFASGEHAGHDPEILVRRAVLLAPARPRLVDDGIRQGDAFPSAEASLCAGRSRSCAGRRGEGRAPEGVGPRHSLRSMPMSLPETVSADYTLRPSELAEVLATLVKARQPTLVWGPPGAAKSMIARQVASDHGYNYVDIRALLLDPVDLRGIPWRDEDGRTRWAPPVFLPPTASTALWLLNLEELASCVPMVQAALYQLSLERKCGEYELPEGASIIACSNRENDRGIVHRMPTPLANRFVHLEIQGRREGLVRLGRGERDRSRSAVLHRAGARAASRLPAAVEGTRLPEPP